MQAEESQRQGRARASSGARGSQTRREGQQLIIYTSRPRSSTTAAPHLYLPSVRTAEPGAPNNCSATPNQPPTQLPSHHQSQCPRSFSGAVSVRNQSQSEPWQSAKTHDILQVSPSAFGNSALRCAPSSSATLSGLTLSSAALAQASATGCRVLSRDNSVSSKTPRNHCSRREEDVPRERAASTSVPTTRRTRRVSSLPLLSAALPPSNTKQFDKSKSSRGCCFSLLDIQRATTRMHVSQFLLPHWPFLPFF